MAYTQLNTMGFSISESIYDYQEKLKSLIEQGKELADSNAIKELIDEDLKSKQKILGRQAKEYYKVNNDILNHSFNKYTLQKPVRDANNNVVSWNEITVTSSGANNKIASAFYPDIVDQKIEFALSNYVKFSVKDGSNFDITLLEPYFDESFDNNLLDIATLASNSGFAGWLFYYPEETTDPMLSYVECDGLDLIPIYDKETQKKLLQIVRYYTVQVETEDGAVDQTRAEIWFPDRVEYWQQDINGNYYNIDTSYILSVQDYTSGEKIIKPMFDFGRVPFALLWNNKDGLSDLNPIKTDIDDYDFNNSLTSNDIANLTQAVIFATGISDNADEFRKNLMLYKVATSPDSNATMTSISVPLESEAREKHLQRLKENIYRFSGSVDFYDETFRNTVSGEAVKRLMIGLELRVNRFLRQVSQFLREVCYFVVADINRKNNAKYNYKDIEWTFDIKSLVNRTELINEIITLYTSGLVDLEESINLLPLDVNKEEMLKRIQSNVSLPDLPEDNTEMDNTNDNDEDDINADTKQQ